MLCYWTIPIRSGGQSTAGQLTARSEAVALCVARQMGAAGGKFFDANPPELSKLMSIGLAVEKLSLFLLGSRLA